ncbi:MAG TPA: hypothetical protein VFB10_09585 [Candidatus Dormibacteraeota bacterium]|nr:hypothetical protein [Candidatus Dormibacteraeota bacterium]
MSCVRVVDARSKKFHLVFHVELHLFKSDFFNQVFGVQVGGPGEFLEFRFVLPVLLAQTLVFGVCIDYYVPRAPLRAGHAFLLFMNGV